jgi:Lrp/AsnC family transcriptional regulator, leucine-responsive regulatory protein
VRPAVAIELDGTDYEIVALLAANARRSLADIAGRVSLSAPAVKRRIDRLEADGVITGYTINVDHARLGHPLEAFIELRFLGSTHVHDLTSTVAGVESVRGAWTLAGDPDMLVRVRVKSVNQLKDVVNDLRKSGRVTGTKTMMVLDAWRAGTQTRGARPAGLTDDAVRSARRRRRRTSG